MAAQPTPYRIEVPQAELDDVNDRLHRTRWPDELPDVGWSYGVSKAYLSDLVAYWRTDYDWRVHESRLNGVPQFTTEIDGQTIHFLHVRSPETDATPLIITHGWPSTVYDFMDILGALTNPRAHAADPAHAFHVVAPSLPGLGISNRTARRRPHDRARRTRAGGHRTPRRNGEPREDEGRSWPGAYKRWLCGRSNRNAYRG
jgi:hypothetical protein